MIEALFLLLGVGGLFLFAPRIGGVKVGPQGGFPWVVQGLVVSDWSLAGTVVVMLPVTFFSWHIPLRPLACVTGLFCAWVLWAWVVSVWRRQ